MELQFSNGYATEIELANGKQNEISSLDNPVQTSFVNVVGMTTWGQMPDDHFFLDGGHTAFRSGLSEIRVFGCDEGNQLSYDTQYTVREVLNYGFNSS